MAIVATDWSEFDELPAEEMARRIVDGRRIEGDESTLEVYEGSAWQPTVDETDHTCDDDVDGRIPRADSVDR